MVRTFPPVSLCQLDGSQLWSTAAVPIQGAQTLLMQPDSPGGSFPMSCHLPGSVALSAVGWVDAQHSKRGIISGCQAEGMAVLVNWKAKLREEKVFLFSKCSLSSEWVWSYGIELPHSQRYLQGYLLHTGDHDSLHWDLSHTHPSNEARVLLYSLSWSSSCLYIQKEYIW